MGDLKIGRLTLEAGATVQNDDGLILFESYASGDCPKVPKGSQKV